MARPIVISNYDERWPGDFERLRGRVLAALGDLALTVEHVGSTAVSGLAAKPIIDLDVVVASAEAVAPAIGRLEGIGYRYEGDLGVHGREAFAQPADEVEHHLYLCVQGAEPLRRHLRFRDALRGDPALARTYGALKRELAARYGSDRDGYTEAKSGFVEAVLAGRPLPVHGFTAVDAQPDPAAWVGVLDRLSAEPFYRRYKARIGELLGPTPGRRYLDVGCGTGEAALALADRYGVTVVGVDISEVMVAEARRRGLEAEVADAASLPFPANTFAGGWADRTFQHLADPDAALRELVRVVSSGGRVVIADPDYDTQVVGGLDQSLARRVGRYRADHGLRNGTLAHQLAGRFSEVGLQAVAVEAHTVTVTDPTGLDNVMGLREWAAHGAEVGLFTAEERERWRADVDRAAADGTFLYALTFFLTVGTVAD